MESCLIYMKFDTLYESLHILDKTTRNLGPDLVTEATLNSSVSSDNSKYYGKGEDSEIK